MNPPYFPVKVGRLIVTWFGCGRVPIAPGTAGSIGALPLCWALSEFAPIYVRFIFAIGFTCIAILAAAQECSLNPEIRDPGFIVVDEVAGMLWATIGISSQWPNSWLPLLIAFGLFRVLDVAKPFPAKFFDRASKISTSWFRRGAHIVMDDVIAGLFSAFILNGLILYGIVN